MLTPKHLQDIAKSFIDSLPPAFNDLSKEMKDNLQTLLAASLIKMNLVTREEFDIQTKILSKTRTKLEALEKQINSNSR